MNIEQFFTYVVAPVIAGAGAIWTIAKVIIPRLVDARLNLDEVRLNAELQKEASLALAGYAQQEKNQELLRDVIEHQHKTLDEMIKIVGEVTPALRVLQDQIKILQGQAQMLSLYFKTRSEQVHEDD